MQTDEVKAEACVLKQPFLTFERVLGLVSRGSGAFILHAIHSAEKEKKGVFAFRVCQWQKCVWLGCGGQCKWSKMNSSQQKPDEPLRRVQRRSPSPFPCNYSVSTIKD